MELNDTMIISGVLIVFCTFMVALAWVSRRPRR